MNRFRIRHFFKALTYLISDRIFLSKLNYKIKANTLLIVKLDAIGDYLLFRNFLEDIRKSKKFANYHITLCGNIIWEELAETFDKSFVDEFIWIDKKKLTNEKSYRKSILQKIKQKGFETAFQPTFSREILTGDSIINASGAKFKFGSEGDDANEISILKDIADGFYSQLLIKNSSVVFEFEKNKIIIEEFIEEEIVRTEPQIIIDKKEPSKLAYAILFPGAGEVQKQWPFERFSAIADMLKNEFNFEIKICGAQSDSELANKIISTCKSAVPINLCGKTNLINLINEISNADFLFTNDSSALHIAACLNIKTVCVLNGRHYGRFAPYPENIVQNLAFVFSDEMDELINENVNSAVLKTKYQAISPIDSISIDKVELTIKTMFE